MKKTTALTTLLAASLLSASAVTGASALDGDTSTTIGPPKPLSAGQLSPIDAGGVPSVRQGKKIPSGYVLVSRAATIQRGTGAAGAAVRIQCPAGKKLRTYGAKGLAFQTTRDYVDQRASVFYALSREAESKGTLYGVCR